MAEDGRKVDDFLAIRMCNGGLTYELLGVLALDTRRGEKLSQNASASSNHMSVAFVIYPSTLGNGRVYYYDHEEDIRYDA
jgi:hypothetical protein